MNKVSKKIDRWHYEIQDNNKQDIIFERDEEYIAQDQSPTNFDSSSSDDDSVSLLYNDDKKKTDKKLNKRTCSSKFYESISAKSTRKK